MVIKQIIINHFGRISHLDVVLNDQTNILRTYFIEEVFLIISRVLSVTPKQSIPPPWIYNDTLIVVTVSCGEEIFTVRIGPNKATNDVQFLVRDISGKDITKRYIYELSHCMEEDDLIFITGLNPSIKDRLRNYLDEERFFSPISLVTRTKGFSKTRTFKKWLRGYIKNSTYEVLDEEKKQVVVLQGDGTFEVICNTDNSEKQVELSKDNEMIFVFMCHLKALELWDGFEKIRDMHYVKKPIIIRDFWEYFSEPEKAKKKMLNKKPDRQIIVLVPDEGGTPWEMTNPLSIIKGSCF